MSSIVIDANVTLAQVIPLPYSDQAEHWMQVRQRQRDQIVVPTLWEYEVVSGLRRAVVQGVLVPSQGIAALEAIMDMAFDVVAPSIELHRLALRWAERLGQSKAYDAQYLALADQLGAAFWTADERLVNSALHAGAARVRWIGESES